MAEWIGGQMTAAGRELQALVEAGETPLIITKMKLGGGSGTDELYDAAIDLMDPQLEVGIASRTAEGGICKISSVVSSVNVERGFYVKELGLYAEHPYKGEILYMYTTDPRPDFLPAHTTTLTVSVDYLLGVVIGNSPNIKIEIDPNSLVTMEMLNNITHTLARNAEYVAGDMVADSQLRPGQYLKCITGGITSPMELIIENPYMNSIYHDGDAVWQIVTIANFEGDCFRRDADGELRPAIPKHKAGDPVLFVEDSEKGGLRLADRFFWSWQFMYDEDGNVRPRPIDYIGPDGGDIDPDEDDDNTPTETEMLSLYDKLKAEAEASVPE